MKFIFNHKVLSILLLIFFIATITYYSFYKMDRKSKFVIYFAYGSNMYTPRILNRVPSAVQLGTGILDGYDLTWHKKSRDGSGKCTIEKKDGAKVYGVLFLIPTNEKPMLDKAEGLGNGYEEANVNITLDSNSSSSEERLKAVTYYATNISECIKPYKWYKDLVIQGALINHFPEEYIQSIAAQEVILDMNLARRDLNKVKTEIG